MIPGLIQWVKDTALSCDVGHRSGSDLALLWLWHRPGATAPIDFTPSLGTSICCGCSPEKKKNKKTKQRNNTSGLGTKEFSTNSIAGRASFVSLHHS